MRSTGAWCGGKSNMCVSIGSKKPAIRTCQQHAHARFPFSQRSLHLVFVVLLAPSSLPGFCTLTALCTALEACTYSCPSALTHWRDAPQSFSCDDSRSTCPPTRVAKPMHGIAMRYRTSELVPHLLAPSTMKCGCVRRPSVSARCAA